MATEYQVENRTLYVRLDGELDHHWQSVSGINVM